DQHPLGEKRLGLRRLLLVRGLRDQDAQAGRVHVLPGAGRADGKESGEQRLETRDQRPETRDQRPETRDQRPETRDQRPETRDQRPETRDIPNSSQSWDLRSLVSSPSSL